MSTWIQKGSDINGEAVDDNSGNSVSLSSDGNTIAIGAIYNDTNGTDSGHVRIYSWIGTSWAQKGTDIDGEADGDYSGYSISLSSDGNTVAIGAPFNDGNGTDSGHARVYSWNSTSWIQKGSDLDGEALGNRSGHSVSLSSDGNTVAIGAIGNDGNGTDSGHVRVYSWNSISWIQKGLDIDGEAAGDFSGPSVSLSSDGNIVAISSYLNDGNGNNSGHVRVYYWNSTSWIQKGLDIDGEAAGDNSGYSVSLSSDGNTVAIGAIGNDGNGTDSGHVRVYSWNSTSWIQKGLDIDGEAAGDQSGFSVSLSSDGDTVAIGSIYNGGNGNNSGHVRVYSWNSTSWIQKGLDIDGEAAGDYSGYSVSLSSDGNTVAIGAIFNDGNGTDSGHARIYYLGSTVTNPPTASNSTYIVFNPIINTVTSPYVISEDTLQNINFQGAYRPTQVTFSNETITQPGVSLSSFTVDPITGYITLSFSPSLAIGTYTLDFDVDNTVNPPLSYSVQFTVLGTFDIPSSTTKRLELSSKYKNGNVATAGSSGSVVYPTSFTNTPILFLNKLNLTSLTISSESNTGFSYTATGSGGFNWLALKS